MIRAHLLPEIKPRSVGAACQPKVVHRQTYKEVCAILRGRLQNARRKEANEIKAAQNTTEIPTVFNLKPSGEQVTEQWMRTLVKNGLPLHLVDCAEFRAAIVMTARAGSSYVHATGEPKLPHRTYMGSKVLKDLDDKLDLQVSECIEGLINEVGAMIISDGWNSPQDRPIINALLTTPVGAKFLTLTL